MDQQAKRKAPCYCSLCHIYTRVSLQQGRDPTTALNEGRQTPGAAARSLRKVSSRPLQALTRPAMMSQSRAVALPLVSLSLVAEGNVVRMGVQRERWRSRLPNRNSNRTTRASSTFGYMSALPPGAFAFNRWKGKAGQDGQPLPFVKTAYSSRTSNAAQRKPLLWAAL